MPIASFYAGNPIQMANIIFLSCFNIAPSRTAAGAGAYPGAIY